MQRAAGSSKLDVVEKVLRSRLAALDRCSAAETDCLRLFAGRADGRDGLVIDRFGPLIVVTDYGSGEPALMTDPGLGSAAALMECVHALCRDSHVIVKARARAGVGDKDAFATAQLPPAQAIAGPLIGVELGMRFELGTDPTHDFGLYLDAAKARQHVRAVARDKAVLNLFSYTAAFGVAAAMGGAESVTNVDPNREYLAWGLRNAALNGVTFRVLPDTAQAFLRKHLRRRDREPLGRAFDLVIVDPPAFGVGRGPERLLRLLWPEIFRALRALSPAEVLLLCNDKYFRARKSFEDLVRAELGELYHLRRLGTCLSVGDLTTPGGPPLDWRPGVEDPHYLEPVVLAGSLRRTAGRPTP